ncbi:MAG: PIG-L family deacetylase, partial [Bacilli bacterium]|nr:PIG-L family deacetylase [Bacilli bacterium]
RSLFESGVIKELYLHVEPYLYKDLVNSGLDKGVYKYESFNESQTETILNALKEYCLWDTKNGKLAIGYHSVKNYFDDALKNPVNYIMKLK